MPDVPLLRRQLSLPGCLRAVLGGFASLLLATSNAHAALDFGDAPVSYGAASHTIVNGLHLGDTAPDAELASQHSFNAFGDGDLQTDTYGVWYLSGDEDGAPHQPGPDYIPLFPVLKMTAMNYSASFQVTNNLGGNDADDAMLYGWIDFDGNGTFEADEAAATSVIDGSNNATVTLSWNVPVDIKLGSTFIRLRLTTDPAISTSTPTGNATDGEVEDFVLAVALDIPPDSSEVTVLKGETPQACQAVVFSDNFNDVPANGGEFLGPNRGAGGGTVITLRDWTISGGGADTYARMQDASGFGLGTAVYLGNGAVRRISPAIGGAFSYDAQGRVTNVIDAIELRDAADDNTPGSTLMGTSTGSHWGPEPVSLSRSFATEIGKVYRVYFKAIPEHEGLGPGAMRIDVPGGGIHLKTPGSDEGVIDYAIEFTADSTNSTLTFVNYGHANKHSDGRCDPVSEYRNDAWCTVGGGDWLGNDLIVDEVTLAESDCGAGSISGVVYTDGNSNNSFDSPAESGINAIAVTLFDDNGTAADLTDDIQVATTSSDASGNYSFSSLDVRKTYRLDVDATDPDLPGQLSIGTTTPLTGVTVVADSNTANQNFGFDPFTYSCPASGTPKIESGFASAVTLDQGVAYEQYALGALATEGTAPTSTNAGLIASSDVLVLDLGEFVPEGAILQLSLARNGSQGNVEVAAAPFNKDFNVLGTFGDNGTLGEGTVQVLDYIGVSVPVGGVRFIRLTNMTASTWVDGVSYNAICTGADDVAEISGTVYRDDNGNDAYDDGTESGLSSVTVSLYDDTDGSQIMVTATDGNGYYYFAGLPADKAYRVEVDDSDSSLPLGASLGTVNSLTGIAVVAGDTTGNQNFGFDIPFIIPPTSTGNPGVCWAIDDDTATIYKFVPDVASPQPPVLIATSRVNSGEGLAWRPSTNELFMWDGTTTYVVNAGNGMDVRSFTADFSPGSHVEGATFYANPSSREEELWLTVRDASSDRYLVRINPLDGTNISAAGPMRGGYIDPGTEYGRDTGGLAIDPNSKQFWITSDSSERGLYSMDAATAVVNNGTLFNPSKVDAESLAFANDGHLYTESDEGPSDDRYVWRIDALTGDIQRAAGPFPGSGDIEGLACDAGAGVFGKDYSDAPADGSAAPAGGVTGYGEARHTVVSGLRLGNAVTVETSAVEDADNASDDGVVVPVLKAGDTSAVVIPQADITGTGAGTLHGWIDFDGDGAFEAQEYASVGFNNGASGDLIFSGFGAVMNGGTTYARFRLTSHALSDVAGTADIDERSTGLANDGEVEDYAVTVASIPAPSGCPVGQIDYLRPAMTSVTNGGAVSVGDSVRYPNVATDDGTSLDLLVEVLTTTGFSTVEEIGIRDESVFFLIPPFAGGVGTQGETTVRLTFVESGTSTPVNVNTEIQIADTDLMPGQRTETISLSYADIEGYTLAANTDLTVDYDGTMLSFTGTQDRAETEPEAAVKFRLINSSSFILGLNVEKLTAGVAERAGFSLDMKNLDILGDCPTYDFGDAPNSYGTVLASDGARHKLTTGLRLGAELDADVDGMPGASANGDAGDEDGVMVPVLMGSETADVTIAATDITGSGVGTLHGWIDFDGDGAFEAAEYASVGFNDGATAPLTFSGYGATMPVGNTYARFRLTADAGITSATPGGVASDGEVEDYVLTVQPGGCSLVVTTTADSDSAGNDSGSLRDAIDCANATVGPDTISFNIPTTEAGYDTGTGVWMLSPASRLPILTDAGTTIDASTQPGSACGDLWATSSGRTLKIQLAGTAGNTRGLDIQGDNFALRGMSVTDFAPGVGIYTQASANNSRFTCNHIGVAADGITAGSNSTGMDLRGSNTYLGDVGVGDGNIISGNNLDAGVGVAFSNTDTSYVYNNFFGTGLDGLTAVPNRLALWNASSVNMQVGGPSAGQRNLFAGNASTGIVFTGPGTDNSYVQGNYIGTDKTGLVALPNQTGINFGSFSTRIAIGGSGSGEGNVISGNNIAGITSDSVVGEDAGRNFIFGNVIGLDKDAVNPLPNQDGIALYEVDDFVIQENIIARNSRLGILLQTGADNVVISHNSIFSNALQGIDLQSYSASAATSVGVTLNDTNDLDSGANGLLNFPILSTVELSDGDMIVQGCAPAGSVVEIFESDVSAGGSATPGDNQFGLSRDYGEGEIFLFSAVEGGLADKDVSGCAIPGGDGNDHSSMQAFFFVVPIPAEVIIHDVISATATVPGEGTSEFGPMVRVTDKPPTIGGGSCPADGGTDILFIVDNSGSISESEFSDFSKSIQDVGSSFLTDNPANRIAVAHFGGPSNSLANGGQHVYIERDFSTTAMIAPVRQFGQGGAYNSSWTADHLAGAVQQMRYALDGNASTTSNLIISPIREMSRNSAIPLQIVLMTDASRYLDNTPDDISMLIDPVGSGAEPNDGSDFTIYNQLKGESIIFSVVSFNVSADASAAAGAIASVGGAYTGNVDSNSADPEGSQVTPRRYVPVTTGFVLELDQVTQMVDSVAICGNNISGVIFEDTVYGGGSGRAFGGFGTVGLPGATIEVYDGAGDYVAGVNSGDGGAYRLPSLPDGEYFVRVVNGTVSSSRTGSDGSEVPVMTYRSNGIAAVNDEIGGRYPEMEDASANADASVLNTTTFLFSSGGLETLPAQSLQPITLNGGAVTNANFGFNFNTVVNKNADGQGSLQQFVLNNNQLASNGIQQQLPALVTPDYATGDSVAVFMIPSSQLVDDEAVINTMTELRIERPGIAIDGRVQSANIGSGRIVLRGDGISLANGVYIGEEADHTALRDFSIENFGGSGTVIFGTGSINGRGAQLERLAISSNGQYGVLIQNDASNTSIRANTITDNFWAGISSEATRNNTFSQNTIYGNGGLGIDLGSDGVTLNDNTDGWLNYPEVAAGSTISSNGSLVVTYDFDLDVPGNAEGYRVEFFSNTELDPSNHGEGEVYLGHVDITSFGAGLQNFKGLMNANQAVPAGAKISVTLTEKTGANSLGATSEFSGVRAGNAAVCTDLLSDPDAPLDTVTVDENSGPVTLLEAKDENGEPITYVISGDADGSQFVVTTVPGALIDCVVIVFIGDDIIGTKNLTASGTRAAPPAPPPGNYEAPVDGDGDNNYELTITATDSEGNTVTKPLTVTVQDVNEKPRITSSSTISFDEAQEGAVVDLEAYDPDAGDAEGSGLTYSVSGGADAGKFMVNPYNGIVTFRVAPDYSNPNDKDADNVYELIVRVADDQGYASSKSLLVNVTGETDSDMVGLRTRALLQGAYVAGTGLMHDKLRVEGLLPLVQPYAAEPFAYIGSEQADAGLLAVEGDDAVVDWVLLELRGATDSSVVITGKAALLQRDGDIVDAVTGLPDISLPVAAGQYYLSLRHRNHLGVITASPVALSDDANANLIDFSQPGTLIQGAYTRLQVAANDGNGDVSLLWSGDVNQDQRIVASGQGSDLNPILSGVLTASGNTDYNSSYQVVGYHASDLNMDGVALFMGPGNDANIVLGNVLLHPANESFLGNFVVEGGM